MTAHPILMMVVLAIYGFCAEGERIETQGDDSGLLGILSLDSGPSETPSTCPSIRVIPDFRIERYMGRWYELERFESPFQNGICGTVDYSLGTNATFNIVNTEFSNGRSKTRLGSAVPASESKAARFHVTLGDIPDGDGSPNYNIVTTDYNNFAVIYTCVTIGLSIKLEFAWIMGRRPVLPEKFILHLKNWLRNFGIDSKNFRKTNQSHCPHVPQRRGYEVLM